MAQPTTAPAVPAGWYPDPGDPHQQRWWDGTAWTTHTSAPADSGSGSGPGEPAVAAASPSHARRWILGGIGGAVVLVLLVVVAAVVLARGDRYPSHWDPQVADIVAFDEQERGLTFEHPVAIVMVPEDEFAESVRVDETELDEQDREDVSSSEAQLRAFGLIDGSTDLVDTTSDIRSAGILAYYSPEEEKVYVRGTELTPAVEATLAHELTHALQDQHFDLREMEAQAPDSGAVRSLVEGDASRIEHAWVAHLPQADQDAIRTGEVSGYEDSGLEEMPDALVAATSAPYALGEPAVGVLAARGDNAEVNQAFLKPPSADVQILDPRRMSEDAPKPVDLPVVPEGATTVSSDDPFGALFWDIVLARRVGIHPALAFADTWAGDTSVTYETAAGRTCTAAAVRGVDPTAASMMLSVLQGWLAAGTQPLAENTYARVRPSDPDVVELGVCDPGTDSTAPGDDNGQQAIALAAVRLELEHQALEAGQTMKAAQCFGDHAVAALDVTDLSNEADQAQVQAKTVAAIQAAAPVCAAPSG